MNRQKGFSLMEATLVTGVTSILAGGIRALPNIRYAKIDRAKNDLHVIASAVDKQLKDLGSRPTVPPSEGGLGPGGATGIGDGCFYSGGNPPLVEENKAAVAIGVGGANTFMNLFTAPNHSPDATLTADEGNALFGLGPGHPSHHFRYRGPYLMPDRAPISDPWGYAYVILGYNQNGQENDGPIWVVSAGESHAIDPINLTLVGGKFPDKWNYVGGSAQNLAIRIR